MKDVQIAIHNSQQARRNQLLKGFINQDDILEKGGKHKQHKYLEIKDGKYIYDYDKMTAKDHKDAADFHNKEAGKASDNSQPEEYDKHANLAGDHWLKSEEKSKKKEDSLSEEDLDLVGACNIHTYGELFSDEYKTREDFDKACDSIEEDFEEEINPKLRDLLYKLNQEKAVEIDMDPKHEGDYTGVIKKRNKEYPYAIETSIDHEPYTIKMKYPIDFDTEY